MSAVEKLYSPRCMATIRSDFNVVAIAIASLFRGIDIVPMEVKSGLRGSMASLYVFMEKEHIKYAIRCSLENFGEFVSPKGKKILVNPLYAISNLFFYGERLL